MSAGVDTDVITPCRQQLMDAPLVSCVMPTADRRTFVPRAISYFLAQDYPNRELVIVDDGIDRIADLVPEDRRVRYIRLNGERTLGAKRNRCVETAHGDLIMHWDDDDWMAPWRISYQVRELMSSGAEICGLCRMLFYELDTGRAWLYEYPPSQRPWLAGGSLLYRRSFWQRSNFPDLQVGSDTHFVWSQPLDRARVLSELRFYVAVIHPGNTSPKERGGPFWSAWTPDLRAVIGDDMDFYTSRPGATSVGSARMSEGQPGANGRTSAEASATVMQAETCVTRLSGAAEAKEPSVSVCLLSYNRPQHLQPIIDSLHDYSFVEEILVWNNNPNVRLTPHGQKVRVIDSSENMICLGRFLCAKQARNSIIFVQDDDVIVRNVPHLYSRFLADPTRIVHGLSAQHHATRDRTHYAAGHLALLGWGAFFHKDWLRLIDDVLAIDGDTPLLRREADKFFSLLLGRRHQTLLGDIELLEHHSTPGIALYLQNDHQLMVALAIRRALALLREWKPVRIPVTWNVVIPSRNYGRFLREAVFSVLLNDADYVVTIVDDASSDDTEQIGRELQACYPWVSYIRHEYNVGAGRARNSGIAAIDSIFVVSLDADDRIGQDYLFQAERLLRAGCDVANPEAILFGESSTRWPVPDVVSLDALLERNPVHCCSGFRRSYWAQVGGFDESLPAWEDYDFWLRLAAAGARIRRLPGDHFYYRKHGPSRSTEADARTQELRSAIRAKHRDLYPDGPAPELNWS